MLKSANLKDYYPSIEQLKIADDPKRESPTPQGSAPKEQLSPESLRPLYRFGEATLESLDLAIQRPRCKPSTRW
jgi:hypothetical protein